MGYVSSSAIQVYPSGYRTDYKSQLITEEGLTSLGTLGFNTNNFVRALNNNTDIQIVMNGYVFQTTKSDIQHAVDNSSASIYADIRTVQISSGSNATSVLASCSVTGDSSIGNLDDSGSFYGISFSNSSTASSLLVLDGSGNVPTKSQLNISSGQVLDRKGSENVPIDEVFNTNKLYSNEIETNKLKSSVEVRTSDLYSDEINTTEIKIWGRQGEGGLVTTEQTSNTIDGNTTINGIVIISGDYTKLNSSSVEFSGLSSSNISNITFKNANITIKNSAPVTVESKLSSPMEVRFTGESYFSNVQKLKIGKDRKIESSSESSLTIENTKSIILDTPVTKVKNLEVDTSKSIKVNDLVSSADRTILHSYTSGGGTGMEYHLKIGAGTSESDGILSSITLNSQGYPRWYDGTNTYKILTEKNPPFETINKTITTVIRYLDDNNHWASSSCSCVCNGTVIGKVFTIGIQVTGTSDIKIYENKHALLEIENFLNNHTIENVSSIQVSKLSKSLTDLHGTYANWNQLELSYDKEILVIDGVATTKYGIFFNNDGSPQLTLISNGYFGLYIQVIGTIE